MFSFATRRITTNIARCLFPSIAGSTSEAIIASLAKFVDNPCDDTNPRTDPSVLAFIDLVRQQVRENGATEMRSRVAKMRTTYLTSVFSNTFRQYKVYEYAFTAMEALDTELVKSKNADAFRGNDTIREHELYLSIFAAPIV